MASPVLLKLNDCNKHDTPQGSNHSKETNEKTVHGINTGEKKKPSGDTDCTLSPCLNATCNDELTSICQVHERRQEHVLSLTGPDSPSLAEVKVQDNCCFEAKFCNVELKWNGVTMTTGCHKAFSSNSEGSSYSGKTTLYEKNVQCGHETENSTVHDHAELGAKETKNRLALSQNEGNEESKSLNILKMDKEFGTIPKPKHEFNYEEEMISNEKLCDVSGNQEEGIEYHKEGYKSQEEGCEIEKSSYCLDDFNNESCGQKPYSTCLTYKPLEALFEIGNRTTEECKGLDEMDNIVKYVINEKLFSNDEISSDGDCVNPNNGGYSLPLSGGQKSRACCPPPQNHSIDSILKLTPTTICESTQKTIKEYPKAVESVADEGSKAHSNQHSNEINILDDMSARVADNVHFNGPHRKLNRKWTELSGSASSSFDESSLYRQGNCRDYDSTVPTLQILSLNSMHQNPLKCHISSTDLHVDDNIPIMESSSNDLLQVATKKKSLSERKNTTNLLKLRLGKTNLYKPKMCDSTDSENTDSESTLNAMQNSTGSSKCTLSPDSIEAYSPLRDDVLSRKSDFSPLVEGSRVLKSMNKSSDSIENNRNSNDSPTLSIDSLLDSYCSTTSQNSLDAKKETKRKNTTTHTNTSLSKSSQGQNFLEFVTCYDKASEKSSPRKPFRYSKVYETPPVYADVAPTTSPCVAPSTSPPEHDSVVSNNSKCDSPPSVPLIPSHKDNDVTTTVSYATPSCEARPSILTVFSKPSLSSSSLFSRRRKHQYSSVQCSHALESMQGLQTEKPEIRKSKSLQDKIENEKNTENMHSNNSWLAAYYNSRSKSCCHGNWSKSRKRNSVAVMDNIGEFKAENNSGNSVDINGTIVKMRPKSTRRLYQKCRSSTFTHSGTVWCACSNEFLSNRERKINNNRLSVPVQMNRSHDTVPNQHWSHYYSCPTVNEDCYLRSFHDSCLSGASYNIELYNSVDNHNNNNRKMDSLHSSSSCTSLIQDHNIPKNPKLDRLDLQTQPTDTISDHVICKTNEEHKNETHAELMATSQDDMVLRENDISDHDEKTLIQDQQDIDLVKYNRDKLSVRCCEDLTVLKEQFSMQIQAVSEELVNLLEARHDFQEQVDMRKIAIEQMFRMGHTSANIEDLLKEHAKSQETC